MNIDKLRQTLTDFKVAVVKETTSDFVCVCPICGDHPTLRKQGHMYISKNAEYPYAHCFFCNAQLFLPQFIKIISGDRKLSEQIISKDEIKEIEKSVTRTTRRNLRVFQLPELNLEKFSAKYQYLQNRVNNKIPISEIPNVIFDFYKFMEINNINDTDSNYEKFKEIFQANMIGFLSKNQTKIFCRNIDSGHWMKMGKVSLQPMGIELLDYYSIPGDSPTSNLIVLGEGNFDILGEYGHDSLSLKKKVRVYAAGQSFSYEALLKSVCFFESIFRVEVVILSDSDKKEYNYLNLKRNNQHVIKNIKLFYNKHPGGDFGSFPIYPYEVKINVFKDKKRYYNQHERSK